MSWRTGRRFPWVLTVSSAVTPMWAKGLLVVLFLSLAGCTPGMFFDLLEQVTETTEQACHRTGGVYESLGDGRHECR